MPNLTWIANAQGYGIVWHSLFKEFYRTRRHLLQCTWHHKAGRQAYMEIWTSGAECEFEQSHTAFVNGPHTYSCSVTIEPSQLRQRIIGFGGAFTEAGAFVFAHMPAELQDRFIWEYFGNRQIGGNGYSLCRTHIQSCDFALGNYAYVSKLDYSLKSFSIDRDKKLLLPFIQCGLVANPNMELIAAPWSPPAFMKTVPTMNFGGHLRPECYRPWARMLGRYLQAYLEEGVRIGRMSMQNEPCARQLWDSCLYNPAEEARFGVRYVKPELEDAGFDAVKLYCWDHNTDILSARVDKTMAYRGAYDAFDGVAFHWYAGDHFDQISDIAARYPKMELLGTEACVELWRDGWRPDVSKAEQYGHAILGQIRSGSQGFIDWNLLLDSKGGPNHARNYCEAPFMYDIEAHELKRMLSYAYIGHFSRFVMPGARCVDVDTAGDKAPECVAFINPDSMRVLVMLNRTDEDIEVLVREGERSASVALPSHSIITALWKQPAPDRC